MMDNRQPDLSSWMRQHAKDELNLDAQARLVTMLTSYLNHRYACRHGYSLIFYQLSKPGCKHPLWGSRHPSYCKLAAIGEAVAAGYEWVVYIDSDAFIRSRDNLATLLRKYGATLGDSGGRADGSPELFFGWDHPFTLGPNMGFIAMRNTRMVRSLLRLWWNVYAGTFSMEHPFEQHTLQWQVMHLEAYASRMQTLSMRTMDESYPDDVVHLDHNAGTKTRIWVMAGAVAQLLVDEDDERVSRNGHSRGSNVRQLRKHLHTLTRPRIGLSKSRRLPAIEAVVRGARRDLESDAMRTCRRLVVPFNASDSALRNLWNGEMGTVATDLRPSTSEGDPALSGMPLQLTNCSDSPLHAPWQTWHLSVEQRTAKGSVCQGLCLAHRFSLQAAPGLCLSLGKTRTPRNPFQTHAQLAPCKAVAETPAAMRARLHFNAKSGSIKTTHRVADFRRGLPEHRTSCGFWPACAGTRQLLPKPCWSALRTNFTACGEEEETVVNHLQRGTVDRTTGFVVTASGPVPASMVNTSGRDRLCLTSWRGFNTEGSAVVFLRCPQGAGRRWRSSRLFEWQTVLQPSSGNDDSEAGQLVRVTPKASPHLCLSVPPVGSPGLAAM